jgi:outer membrane lipopolysaccharide assembly protein LptE/RlpB
MNIQKLSIPVTMAATLLVCLLTAAGSYYKAMADIREEFHVIRLEREQQYAKKEELLRFESKIDTLRDDVAELKGILRQSLRR